MNKNILIKNARVVDAKNNVDDILDILIENDCIIKLEKNIDAKADLVIDATGMMAIPGVIDMHVHLRDPGFEYKEDIVSGAKAAAAGGVTTVAAMPNTKPVTDNPEIVKYILEKASKTGVRVLPVAAITSGLNGEMLTDFKKLKEAGVIAVSDDGKPVATAKLMADAMKTAKENDIIILAHCEDISLAGKGIINEGKVSKQLEVEGIPNSAEDVGTAREISLAASTDSKVHICHVSTKTSIDMIRSAKKDGVNVTAETAPHYFMFNEEKLLARDADYRMNPPLRTDADCNAIIEAIKDGTLDAIATDHAPHSKEEKSNFLTSPNGVVGMETSLSATITSLVKTGIIDYKKLVELMSFNPAKILGLDLGTISVGAKADIAIFDPDEKWLVDPTKLHGKSVNAIFKGMELFGKVKYTICNGELIFKEI